MNAAQIERIEALFAGARQQIEDLKSAAVEAEKVRAEAIELAPKAIKDLALHTATVLDILDLVEMAVARGFAPSQLPADYTKALDHCHRFAAITVFTLDRGLNALTATLEALRLDAAVQSVELPEYVV